MRSIALTVLILAGLFAPAQAHGADEANRSRTLTGSYHWDQGDEEGNLQVIFVPTGERKWDVSFTFKRGSKDYTWMGTAEGSLDKGTLSGQVRTDGRGRVFSFRGEFEDGTFHGRHFDGDDPFGDALGTLTLKG